MKRPNKICDVCGQLFYKGVIIPGIRKKRQKMCEKCENTMKLMILYHRRKKEI